MINIFLFVLCLVNSHVVDASSKKSHVVDGILGTLQEQTLQLENYAGAFLQPASGTSFHGVSGIVSVYNPRVEKEQMSSATMSVLNGSPNNINGIIVGWHVYPQMYDDDKTHFFIAWGSDNFNKGCYNLQCNGFVQTEKSITPGQIFDQTSIISGITVEVPMAIFQDPTTKDWHISVNEKEIGYYPASLFSNMTYVEKVWWGGKTINPRNTPSPPMGYGMLPDGVLSHACYFKNLAFVNEFQKSQALTKDMGATLSTNRQCYGASYHDGDTGFTLQFGGPGGGNCIV